MTSYQCMTRSGAVVCFRETRDRVNGDRIIEFHTSLRGGESWSTPLEARQWTRAREGQMASVQDKSVPEAVIAAVYLMKYRNAHAEISDVKTATLDWGRRYPRMWRGHYNANPLLSYSPVDAAQSYGSAFTSSAVAAESLFSELLDMFRYVEPADANRQTYGHRFRELIILACTEVEACLRGVLVANTAPTTNATYTTKHYVKLCAPLKLKEWSIGIKDYPEYPDVSPFASWDAAQATKSLPWYDSYNAVKHDREGAFSRATVGAVIDAMAAVFVMQCAQWGGEVYSLFFGNRDAPFVITKAPVWDVGEFYAPDPADPEVWIDEAFPL